MNTSCVNFTELRFTSERELRRYLENVETIWTAELMRELANLGLQRKSITRIWNHNEQFKLGILWEYASPKAFKDCQKVITKSIHPHAHKFEMVARSYRGIPILDWRGDQEAFTKSSEKAHEEILSSDLSEKATDAEIQKTDD